MKKFAVIQEKLCQGKDIFERMNYLHQVSLLVSSQNIALASYYNFILLGCSKKAVLRMEHNIKQFICKICQSPLIPGQTAKVRLISRKKKVIKIVCCICKNIKKIPMKENHNLWFDQPDSLLETFKYRLMLKTNDIASHGCIVHGVQINNDIKSNKIDNSTSRIK